VWAEQASTDLELPVTERVRSLLGLLSLDEKLAMMHQYSVGVPRLGIPPVTWGIAVRRGADPVPGATVFPQAIGLGATWNPDLLTRIGSVIAVEVRAYYHSLPDAGLAIWGPVANLLRDPRWGRNEEGYAECPVLTSALVTAMCRGLSGHLDPDAPRPTRMTTPVLQHFLAYNHENGGGARSVKLRPRVLHEYDLRPFKTPIVEGVADGVMLAYSRVNGVPNHLSPHIRGHLRSWDPHSVVMSDAWGPSFLVMGENESFQSRPRAYAAAVHAGLDLFVDQGDRSDIIADNLRRALKDGLLSEATLDAAVGRLLRMRIRWGQLDQGDGDGADAEPQVTAPEHGLLAARAAAEAIVLLSNRDGLLPLNPGAVRRVAVVGQLAAMVCRDWYAPQFDGGFSAVAGVAALLGRDRVILEEGVDVVALRYGDRYVTASERPDGGALTWQTTAVVQAPQAFALFDWGRDVVCLRAEVNGRFVTSLPDRTLANDQVAPNGWVVHERFKLVPHGGGAVLFDVSADRYVAPPAVDGALRVAATTVAAAAVFQIEVVADGVAAVSKAAAVADAVIAVVGNHPLINGRETDDRVDIGLAPRQAAVATAAAAANVATVVALVSSYPLAVEEIAAEVPAMVWSSHAGPELGTSLADAVFGARPPAGRLPQTWPRHVQDLGDMYEYDIIKGRKTYLYSEAEPLFPFGHGLTYTRFWYDLSLRRPILCVEDSMEVSVEVGNLGPVDSDEVIQIYARARQSRHPRPLRQLLAFRRVHIPVGTTRSESFTIPLQELALWDVDRHELVVEPGDYDIMLARSSLDIAATKQLTVRAEPAGPRRLDLGPVRASDFDDYHAFWPEDDIGTGLTTMVAGDSGGWLLFRDVSIGGTRLRVRATRAAAGWVAIEVRADGPAGELLAVVPVVAGVDGDLIDVPLSAGVERRDLYFVSLGAVRLATLQLHSSVSGAGT
jgi:beta-glucosidase